VDARAVSGSLQEGAGWTPAMQCMCIQGSPCKALRVEEDEEEPVALAAAARVPPCVGPRVTFEVLVPVPVSAADRAGSMVAKM
jgi:hypothetical protein